MLCFNEFIRRASEVQGFDIGRIKVLRSNGSHWRLTRVLTDNYQVVTSRGVKGSWCVAPGSPSMNLLSLSLTLVFRGPGVAILTGDNIIR